jgi:hypothetical protein
MAGIEKHRVAISVAHSGGEDELASSRTVIEVANAEDARRIAQAVRDYVRAITTLRGMKPKTKPAGVPWWER